jgi:hypothetical protein
MSTYYDEDELADLKREFRPRKRKAVSCADGMCGADDCERCGRGTEPDEEEDSSD